jgi:Ca2+-binding EF-hand superfamily protein
LAIPLVLYAAALHTPLGAMPGAMHRPSLVPRAQTALAHSQPPLRVAELRLAFNAFDDDGDGLITRAELDDAMKSSGHVLLDDELSAVMHCELVDGLEDSYADRMIRRYIGQAFPKAARPADAESKEHGTDGFAAFDLFHEVSMAFEVFDENNDGAITCEELGNVLRSLGYERPSDADLMAAISAYDENRNGKIEFDEFCQMVTDHVRPPGVDDSVVEMVSCAARDAVSGRRLLAELDTCNAVAVSPSVAANAAPSKDMALTG